jgi:hypothetical protein
MVFGSPRSTLPTFSWGVSTLITAPMTLSSPPRQTSRMFSHQSQKATPPAAANASMRISPHGKVP